LIHPLSGFHSLLNWGSALSCGYLYNSKPEEKRKQDKTHHKPQT